MNYIRPIVAREMKVVPPTAPDHGMQPTRRKRARLMPARYAALDIRGIRSARTATSQD